MPTITPLPKWSKAFTSILRQHLHLCRQYYFLEQLKNYAYHDTLVNLPNRLALEQIIDAKLTQELDTHYALALIDINHFADLNAVLGQEHGDRLLIAIAERLKIALNPLAK